MRASKMRAQRGFTLVELMVTLGIIGMLASLAMPLASSYRMKAEYASLTATLRYLMDGQETYFIENDSFYPPGSGSITVNQGQQKDIPEIAYTFPADHKHRYIIRTINFDLGTWKLNYYWIYVYADFDRNGNGQNDLFVAMTYFLNNDPISSGGTRYYRLIQQVQ